MIRGEYLTGSYLIVAPVKTKNAIFGDNLKFLWEVGA